MCKKFRIHFYTFSEKLNFHFMFCCLHENGCHSVKKRSFLTSFFFFKSQHTRLYLCTLVRVIQSFACGWFSWKPQLRRFGRVFGKYRFNRRRSLWKKSFSRISEKRIWKCQKTFLAQFKPAYKLSKRTPNINAFWAWKLNIFGTCSLRFGT